MTWLFWWIRSWFCKHEFEFSETRYEYEGTFRIKTGVKVSALCKKCSFHRVFWKV